MDLSLPVSEFSKNKNLFSTLLTGLTKEEYLWKPNPDKWCLLEIVCHLYDEEREDFRARIGHLFTNPEQPLLPISPADWVAERKYIQQDFSEMLEKFLKEREESVQWLQSLRNPPWKNVHQHPKLGPVTGACFLNNWLAHDYLHIRQIVKLKYDRLKELSSNSLSYAGNW